MAVGSQVMPDGLAATTTTTDCPRQEVPYGFRRPLPGYAWSDEKPASNAPLREFESELGVQGQTGPRDTAGFTTPGRTEHFDRSRQAELKHESASIVELPL